MSWTIPGRNAWDQTRRPHIANDNLRSLRIAERNGSGVDRWSVTTRPGASSVRFPTICWPAAARARGWEVNWISRPGCLPGPRSRARSMVYSKDRRRAGGACGRAMPVQGGVGNPRPVVAGNGSGGMGFSTPPAGSTGLFTLRARTPPPSLGPGNAPSRSSGYAGVRSGPSGHGLPRPGSGPHAPGLPRSPPGDDPTAGTNR